MTAHAWEVDRNQGLRDKVLIVGLGRTGLSCARYLAGLGVTVAITDSREQPPGLEALVRELPDTALFLGRFEPAAFAAAEQLVVSPGVSLQEPLIREARARGVPVLGDVELFARQASAPVAAITGSNGKSTVTTLLGEMADRAGRRPAVGGNLGRPALELLDSGVGLYVLELSSFQLETLDSLAPAAATVLNLSADHLDRYSSFQAYAAAKARILRRARVQLLNRDDPRVMALPRGPGEVRGFTLGEPAEGEFGIITRDGDAWLAQGSEPLLPAARLLVPGRHNRANALAALALGDALGLPMAPMLEALGRFRGLPHRTQFVGEYRGVRWYNDSKGTNPGACVAALEGLHQPGSGGRTVLIAGGDAKGADFAPLTPVLLRTARAVVLIGRDAPRVEAALDPDTPRRHAAGLDQAVQLAAEQARPGDRVLFSPACASFDMFRNYEQRGEAFMESVRRLLA
ncbi:MAG TPA: UDP-N-acetylmuramoyl-L-alanine--D-glutamate ligase [Sedimenticola sp.]|nr:UDP-N-acetylmuramoyl-L-alanine--D-glutamate ligase [Sedimenticola sp.]